MERAEKLTKLFVIAGEDSGDLHAANLIKALRKSLPHLQVRGMGGDHLEAAGCDLVAHLSEGNFMGFVEVIRNLGTIRGLFRRLKSAATVWKPDAVLLVDYPGFNLRIAPFFQQMGCKVYYYISPQVWAWKKGRVNKIRRLVDRMFVILPFEQAFYQKEGVEVEFVGHPLLDAIDDMERVSTDARIIALLPGSRKQEIQRMLPVMLSLIPHFPEYRFIVAGAPSQATSFYMPMLEGHQAELWMNRTYELLRHAEMAAVTSGTATLETALFRVPQVVCYKGSRISYEIGKRLVKVSFISLVNLILNREVVKELIQTDFTPPNLLREMKTLLPGPRRQQMLSDYEELGQALGDAGASETAAHSLISHFVSSRPSHD